MAKDKLGHGSEKRAVHGSYSHGRDYHGGPKLKISVTRPIEHKIEDIGPGGKKTLVEKSSGWKD